jgi:hypothetical protein
MGFLKSFVVMVSAFGLAVAACIVGKAEASDSELMGKFLGSTEGCGKRYAFEDDCEYCFYDSMAERAVVNDTLTSHLTSDVYPRCKVCILHTSGCNLYPVIIADENNIHLVRFIIYKDSHIDAPIHEQHVANIVNLFKHMKDLLRGKYSILLDIDLLGAFVLEIADSESDSHYRTSCVEFAYYDSKIHACTAVRKENGEVKVTSIYVPYCDLQSSLSNGTSSVG